jgi:hypothetical protein
MLFVTDFIQLLEPIPYQESCLRVWRLQNWRIIHTVKYADDIVLLVKKSDGTGHH